MSTSNDIQTKQAIEVALKDFADQPLADAAIALFEVLGYKSKKRLKLSPNNREQFLATFAQGKALNDKLALSDDWKSIDFLFQITDDEIQSAGGQQLLFESKGEYNGAVMESYLFLALDLKGSHYTRTMLSGITRELNKLFAMPALVLFRHGDTLTFAIINRRLNKRDQTRDVLEKVTLIKDICFTEPIRAHAEILNDFSLANLDADFETPNFVKLHEAWQRRLGSYALSNDFYREIADWYFWAHHLVDSGTIRLPQHCDTEQEKSLFLIRLLTRVIFCWFLVEKRLIPADLFRDRPLKKLIKDLSPDTSTYYHAVLQNLFFGTLNMPGDRDLRGFREKKKGGQRYDPNYGITNLWRYETDFHNPADWLKLAERIPFLNGGLFDCLDDKSGKKQDNFILDGFSDNPDLACRLPNDLFFGPERNVDLSKDYGEEDKRTARSKRAKVRGLIEILSRYKFTIEENTPLEEEIALDPELLGKVFENLLASYNEDTQTTARKALGAFYTPREIVTYMVDEALKSYLTTQCPSKVGQTFPSASSSDKVGQTFPSASSSDKVGQTFLSATSPDGIATTHRRLPHWHKDGAVYWVTFRLDDSLPQDKLSAWKAERDAWRACHPEPWSEADWKEYDERFGERLEAWLDAGLGSRALARPDVREAVKQCLIKFDGERLHLHAAVIMPTHLHALIEPLEGQDLSKLLKGIKGASAREANKLLKTSGTFWLDEAYDHIVRSEAQYRHFLRYIAENPLKAKLPASDYWFMDHQGGAGIPACDSHSPRQTRMSAPLSKRIASLFSTSAEQPSFTTTERDALIAAIGRVKILDPACGSGAFPMGALHRLVDLLQKLDPNNELWKRDRLAEAERYCQVLEETGAPKEEIAACHARIEDITKSFDTRFHALDFARKLYLIENGIYGVDIQPVAVQIAKLRFFISLVVDQKVDMKAPNLGVRPLPNLETRLVAADTLIPLKLQLKQADIFDNDSDASRKLEALRNELKRIRHEHFNARDPGRKRHWRDEDQRVRETMRDLLRKTGMPSATAKAMSSWDPYDQNTFATFFDSEWMFGLKQSGADIPVCASNGGAGIPVCASNGGADIPVCDADPMRQTGMSAPLSHTPFSQGPFDIVIGNPPYIRIQTLKKKDPKLVEFYKDEYASAAKGNYDLYVVFIEAGLRLLKSDGHLAYICPHKFFNAQYGEPIRELIAKGRCLRHVVHFGDEQVFPGASIYTCLLFLAKEGAKECRFLRATNLATWTTSFSGIEGRFASDTIGKEEWNFTVGKGRSIFEQLQANAQTLEDVTTRIFQGIKTSADKIYIVEERKRSKSKITIFSPQTEKDHEVEPDLFHPLIKGGDSRAFTLTKTDRLILFPYAKDDEGQISLISPAVFKQKYPLTWAYLKNNHAYLENREDGAMKGENWYAYGRNQALDVMPLPKLFTPDLSLSASFAFDVTGEFFFTGGVAGGYGILPNDGIQPKWLLALLNSRVVDFFHHQIATQMRGGWYSYESRFIKNLPIVDATPDQVQTVVGHIDRMLSARRYLSENPADQSTRDPLMLAYFEQILNGLVYELYFPEEVHGTGLHLFDAVAKAKLPAIETIPDEDRLPRLRTLFETLYDGTHPLRIALDKLQTLDTVRIIEGKV